MPTSRGSACLLQLRMSLPTSRSLPACLLQLLGKFHALPGRLAVAMLAAPAQPQPFPCSLQPSHHPCRAPSIAIVPSMIGITTATVSVAPPATAPPGGWAKYVLTVCRVGGSCGPQSCTPVNANGTRTMCTLTGLLKNTNYTVSAAAVNGTISSRQSAEKAFKTSNQE